MATYSLSFLGAPADNPAQPQILDVDDAFGAPGSMARAMTLNTTFLCRGLDGAERWYTYDAERSIPGGARVLKLVS